MMQEKANITVRAGGKAWRVEYSPAPGVGIRAPVAASANQHLASRLYAASVIATCITLDVESRDAPRQCEAIG